MNDAVDLGTVKHGFEQPALDAQRLYRRLLDAMAWPGRQQDLSEAPEPPVGLHRSTAGIALTLLDFETRLWLDPALRGSATEAWLRFHCGCPLTHDPRTAAFAVVADARQMPGLDDFAVGDAHYPDRSTTLIVQLPSLSGGAAVRLTGPGIDGHIDVAPTGLPGDFWAQLAENRAEFQLGVDLLLVDEAKVLGLPRSTRWSTVDAAAPAGTKVDPAGKSSCCN